MSAIGNELAKLRFRIAELEKANGQLQHQNECLTEGYQAAHEQRQRLIVENDQLRAQLETQKKISAERHEDMMRVAGEAAHFRAQLEAVKKERDKRGEALTLLRNEVQSARDYRGSGGMKPNHPPDLFSCTPVTLSFLDRIAKDALAEETQEESGG